MVYLFGLSSALYKFEIFGAIIITIADRFLLVGIITAAFTLHRRSYTRRDGQVELPVGIVAEPVPPQQ